MRRWGAALLACALALMLAGCGKKTAPDNETPAANTTTAPVKPGATTAQVEQKTAPDAAKPENAEPAAAAQPQVGASEVDEDEEEPTGQSGSSKGVNIQTEPAVAEAALQFKEGTHYQRLTTTQPTSAGPGHIEVAEVFWYNCPHCYALDPLIETWRTTRKASYVDFVRIPAMWNDTLRTHARMFYTAQALGKLDELHPLMFKELQLNGNPLDTQEKIGAFFKSHGVSEATFRQTFNSLDVQTKLNQADILNRRYRIQSVPTFIVNGKYITDVGLAGSQEKLLQLVNELAARDHGR